MLTNNFNKIMAAIMMNGKTTAVDYAGATKNLSYYPENMKHAICLWDIMSTVSTTLANNYHGVFLGDGTTPPTKNDYSLSGNVITTIKTTITKTSDVYDDGVASSAVYTVTNTGSEAITISEICLFGRCNYNTGTSVMSPFLLDRTLLDSPITIPAGGVGQVTYTIRMNYPTA